MEEKQTNIQQAKLADKAHFQDLQIIRKINNLSHKLTTLLQKNKELITDNYLHLE
jgi:hypothetical protein